MTSMLDIDPQAGLPEYLRRRQPNYAQAPTGLLSQQAYGAAGPFPQYQPQPMTINPPLPPAPDMPGAGQTGSDGGGLASGLGGILGAALQNPNAISSIGRGLSGLLNNNAPLSSILSPSASNPAMISPSAPSIGMNPGVDAAISAAAAPAAAQGLQALSASQVAAMGPSAAAMQSQILAANPVSGIPSLGANAAGGLPWGTIGAGAAALGGGLLAYDGIKDGREGQAALGGALAGGGLAGLTGLAALGPAGLVGAGVAALASSLVNTKEFGDVALRNYWEGVDSGRNIGESDPTELAQGFVNFYRTNKNDFAPQAVYGRTGNEDFLYDMQRHINGSIEGGRISADATPGEVYEHIVKPWMATMGDGPQDEKAQAIQDFMMTDLINSYQQGKPISNAQVKGDSKYQIVSAGLRYPGQATQAASPQEALTPNFDMSTMGLLGAM